MYKTITLKNKQKKPIDKGFITIEIIISLLIAFGFLMVSLQTLVLGMVFKVKAQEEQRADKLIQEDIERLKDIGGSLSFTTFASATNLAQACNGLDLDSDGTIEYGYGKELWDALIADTPSDDPDLTVNLLTTASGGAGKTLTLRRAEFIPPASDSPTPHRILGVAYEVTKPDEDGDGEPDVIANRYVEVIPDEALECP